MFQTQPLGPLFAIRLISINNLAAHRLQEPRSDVTKQVSYAKKPRVGLKYPRDHAGMPMNSCVGDPPETCGGERTPFFAWAPFLETLRNSRS